MSSTDPRLAPRCPPFFAITLYAGLLSVSPDLIEAARQLDETMTEIKDSGRLMSLERIALQAALNYSAELIALRRLEDRRQESIDSRIRTLADRLDDALKD